VDKPKKTRGVEAVDRKRVRAIAVDANAFGGGHFSLEPIKAWAKDAAEADLELWLPEVVAWELAASVADRFEEMRDSMKRLDGILRQAGLTGLKSPYPDHQSVVGAVLEKAESQPMKLLKTTADEAFEALKDQVQLRPPGRRKSKVKTGAADSAWVRSVLREAAQDTDDEIIIVSGDGDIDEALSRAAPPNVALASHWDEVRRVLFEYEASQDAALDLVSILVTRISEGSLGRILDLASVQDAGFSPTIEGGRWTYQDPLTVQLDVEGISALAALRDVEANTRGSVRANALFLGDVLVTGWFDDESGQLAEDHLLFHDAAIEAPLFVALERGAVSLAVLEANPALQPTRDRWWSEEDALAACLVPLEDVPALAGSGIDFSLLGQVDEPDRAEVNLGGTTLGIEISTETGLGWKISATAGDDRLIVSCDYDHSAWIGGSKEGEFMVPPFELSAWSETVPDQNPIYAVSALAMTRSVD
jgi:hypothetical protein